MGGMLLTGSPADYRDDLIAAETEKWGSQGHPHGRHQGGVNAALPAASTISSDNAGRRAFSKSPHGPEVPRVSSQPYRREHVEQHRDSCCSRASAHRFHPMQNNSADMERAADASQGPEPPTYASRSATAGREFLRAVGSDLAALTARLREQGGAPRAPPRSPTGRRFIPRGPRFKHRGTIRCGRMAPRVRRRTARCCAGSSLASASVSASSRSSARWRPAAARVSRPLNSALPSNPPPQGGRAAEPAARSRERRAARPPRPDRKTRTTPLARFSTGPDDQGGAVKASLNTRFFHHFGVDPVGILRLVHRNMDGGRHRPGWQHPITQQLVKQALCRRYPHLLRASCANRSLAV